MLQRIAYSRISSLNAGLLRRPKALFPVAMLLPTYLDPPLPFFESFPVDGSLKPDYHVAVTFIHKPNHN